MAAVVITPWTYLNIVVCTTEHCEHISLTSLKQNELLLILFCVQKMKNWLHETVFNFAAYYIFIKLGYYSNHSPLLNYVHSFGQHYRIDRFGH